MLRMFAILNGICTFRLPLQDSVHSFSESEHNGPRVGSLTLHPALSSVESPRTFDEAVVPSLPNPCHAL